MLKQFFALALGLSLVVACGKDQPGNSAAYRSGSQNCSSQFISEYNSVNTTLQLVAINVTRGSVEAARTKAVDFKSKYGGVVCDAENLKTGNKMSVDVNAKMDEIIALMDKALALL